MTDRKFLVLYYGIHVVAVLFAPDRVSAVRQMGAQFGGQVGLTIKEAV